MTEVNENSSEITANGQSSGSPASFAAAELRRQLAYFDRVAPHRATLNAAPHRFARLADNLSPAIGGTAERYFRRDGANAITWHTHSSHMLSSQACCLNFLMPLAEDPARLSQLVSKALGIAPPEMCAVEDGPDGRPWFIGFEWIGRQDYFREAGKSGRLTRGANCTSADAFMKFRHNGVVEGLLVEWKYTETYGARLRDGSRVRAGEAEPSGGHVTRRKRYGHLMFAPDGPLRLDRTFKLDDFFYEPLYQLIRQQMLAYQMERNGEADVVRVLHISPRGNGKLHAVTSPHFRGHNEQDVFALFRSLLVDPDRFISCVTDDLFGVLLAAAPHDDPWARYVKDRYAV